MKHSLVPEFFDWDLKKLAIQIGDLRYDALEELFCLLKQKINTDAKKDEQRRRKKLSSKLFEIADLLSKTEEKMWQVWQVCKPYMEDK